MEAMSAVRTPEATVMPERAQDATGVPDGPSCRTFAPERPHFTPVQQKAFDRAFAKREAKLRAEFAALEGKLRNDIMEMVWACEQLLFKKLSPQHAQEIARGVDQIKREYSQEATSCQKSH